MKNKNLSNKKTMSIVLNEVSLSDRQRTEISQITPQIFVKTKPGRGGKTVNYVETGYIVSRLNAIFSPAGWDFEIVAQGDSSRQTEKNSQGEVWVRGRLTIIDHQRGYRVSKTQYGQHPIHSNVPIGDSFKSAASDCLKKCASLFGIAHDVYWKISEQEDGLSYRQEKIIVNKKESKKNVTAEDMEKIKKIINNTRSVDFLIQTDERIQSSLIYNKDQKNELQRLISRRVDEINEK